MTFFHFRRKFDFFRKFSFLAKILIFGEDFDYWRKIVLSRILFRKLDTKIIQNVTIRGHRLYNINAKIVL